MSTFLNASPIFGPVRSRRLGLSLGVNMMPASGKICTFDCIYCENGLNAERPCHEPHNTAAVVLDALEAKLREMTVEGELPDVITFAGNGEPTAAPEFPQAIAGAVALRDQLAPNTKIAVLSNGTRADRPVGSYGTALSADFTVVFADPLNSRNIERVVTERLNRNIWGFLVRPIAIADAVLTADDRNAGCMLVDMGAETTTCSVYAQGVLQYVATIPMGGRNITHDLAVGLGVTEQRAEQIKISVGKAINENGTAPAEEVQVDNIVQARVYEILQNVIAQIGFAGFNEADMRGGIVITGGSSRLYGLNQVLHILSGLNVRVANIPASVHISDPADNTSANIDIIALSLAARQLAESDGCECVTYSAKEEEEAPADEPAEVVEETVEDRVEIPYDDEDDDEEDTPAPAYGQRVKADVPAYDEYDEEDLPTREKDFDDIDVLLSDEEIEARRAADRKKNADERLKEARRKDKEQKAAEKRRKLGNFINRFGNFLAGKDDDGEGNDI